MALKQTAAMLWYCALGYRQQLLHVHSWHAYLAVAVCPAAAGGKAEPLKASMSDLSQMNQALSLPSSRFRLLWATERALSADQGDGQVAKGSVARLVSKRGQP
jgi:hypothetical protein